MEDYLSTRECLMAFLARGAERPRAAALRPVRLLRGPAPAAGGAAAQAVQEAEQFLQHFGDVIEPRRLWPAGPEGPRLHGKIPEELRAEPGRALCLWGDPGLGELVRRGKQREGRFGEELVRAAAELVRRRWRIAPPGSPAFRRIRIPRW